MMVAVETLYRRVLALGKRWWSVDWVRQLLQALALGAGGFLASAASLRGGPVPLAMGPVLGERSRKSLWVCLGSALGSRIFWGDAGSSGVWWALAAGALALLRLPEGTLPVLGVLAVGITELCLPPPGGLAVSCLRLAVALGSIWCFLRQDRLGRWLRCAAAALALGQVAPLSWLGLGFVWAAALTVGASFPGAALAGLGLDLAHITALPMTAVISLGWLGRLLPGRRLRWLLPAAAGLLTMAALGTWDLKILPGLALGGLAGSFFPRFPDPKPRRGDTGPAQVRLELAAGAMEELRRTLLAQPPPQVDRGALLQRVRTATCGSCSARKSCLEQERLTRTALEDGHPFPCRKPGRLRPELVRAREQLKLLRREHRRREEYRQALALQYGQTAQLLRHLADRLPRGQEQARPRYGVTVAVRTRRKESASGDRWAAFPGSRGRYFVLLCDGMGTGPGAGEEGKAAVRLLRQLLTAELEAEQALRAMDTVLTLTDRAGAVTVDLAELRLDTGQALLYKWGAAPSWKVKGSSAEKIGTATLPPGLTVGEQRQWQGRLSLRGGSMLILISDGVDGEEVPHRVRGAPDAPPGELAERLLEGPGGKQADDATAAVIRLYPLGTGKA